MVLIKKLPDECPTCFKLPWSKELGIESSNEGIEILEENEANNNNNDQQHLIPKRITLSYEKEVKPILDGTYFETLHGVLML